MGPAPPEAPGAPAGPVSPLHANKREEDSIIAASFEFLVNERYMSFPLLVVSACLT